MNESYCCRATHNSIVRRWRKTSQCLCKIYIPKIKTWLDRAPRNTSSVAQCQLLYNLHRLKWLQTRREMQQKYLKILLLLFVVCVSFISVSHFRSLKWETTITFISSGLGIQHPDLNPMNYKIGLKFSSGSASEKFITWTEQHYGMDGTWLWATHRR